ncbi:Rec8 like protein-domain-containing protein [Xylaria sp. FL0064]|nr:Rec8 like protein-domain-containing protein [Xylaria sp. FL0064]
MTRRLLLILVRLVATTSQTSSTRRVTRKAIQEVDVQRACGKILEPGAPIALRLQGNLLYGVSRVHNQQCTYLVADAKKIQDQMKFFFQEFPNNQLDLEAGKARPEDNLIEYDPAFDLNMPLPQFDLDTLVPSQIDTQKTSSQMSPPSSQLSGSRSPGQGFAIQLDLDHSSSSGFHGSPFGLQDPSSAQKLDSERPIFTQEDDVFGTQGDWGIEIDENGNIVESAEPIIAGDEPQLPPLPHIQGEDNVPVNDVQLDERPILDDQDIIMQEEPLPEVEPFPERQRHAPGQDDINSHQQQLARRKRKLQVDEDTQLPRRILRHWQSHYLENCGAYPTSSVSATQAKRNAMLLTFGLGIGNIGQSVGVPGLIHPLAVEFSGDVLFTTITGIEVEKPRGRRRTASEAIDDNKQEGDRRVKPRLRDGEDGQEQARVAQQDDFINLDDPFAEGVPTEVGRQADHPMSDHPSSTHLPWNRGSSAIPGSSARAPNLAQQGRDLSSPLGKRGDAQDIVRFSDDAPMGGFGSELDFGGGFGSQDSFDGMQVSDIDHEDHGPRGELTAAEIQAQNDHLFAQLDREGQNFVNFIRDAIDENGERRHDEDFDVDRKWLAFDDLFVPHATPRSTAAQAFYHTLCLVTKRRMHVEQHDANQTPFGAIWIGMKGVAGNF